MPGGGEIQPEVWLPYKEVTSASTPGVSALVKRLLCFCGRAALHD